MMRSLDHYSAIQLWFELDLYDQLQILQILDFLAQIPDLPPVSLFCTEHYLGMIDADTLKQNIHRNTTLSLETLSQARKYWDAFTRPGPDAWCDLIHRKVAGLPYLNGAVLRMCQEFPDEDNGLSLTMNRTLAVLETASCHPGRLFGDYIKTEVRKFLGDLSFFRMLNALMMVDQPLLESNRPGPLEYPFESTDLVSLTPLGKRVLDGQIHWLDIEPSRF